MSQRNWFLGIFFSLVTLLLLPPVTNAADVVVYTTFGPDQSFNEHALQPICDFTVPLHFTCKQSVAAPFTPSQTVILTQIDLAVISGPDQLVVQLLADAGGVPGALLESWNVTDLPSNIPFVPTSVTDTLGLKLTAGTQYWVEVAPSPEGGLDHWAESLTTTGTFSLLNQNDPSMWVNHTGAVPAFDVRGDTTHIPFPHYVGGAFGQIIREVAGPVVVPPGVPVEVNLGFVDLNGNSIGPSMTKTLTTGETAILDLNVNTLAPQSGQRVEVRPVVTVVSGPAGPNAVSTAPVISLRDVTEVFDAQTGAGTVLVPGEAVFPPSPAFEFQGVAGAETMRLIVSAYPPAPCAATLRFVDDSGSPVGMSMPVNLEPGQTASLDLTANMLGLQPGQRMEIQPIVSTMPSVTSGPPIRSACLGSAEVFDQVTGRTATYQSGGRELLPAVQ